MAERRRYEYRTLPHWSRLPDKPGNVGLPLTQRWVRVDGMAFDFAHPLGMRVVGTGDLGWAPEGLTLYLYRNPSRALDKAEAVTLFAALGKGRRDVPHDAAERMEQTWGPGMCVCFPYWKHGAEKTARMIDAAVPLTPEDAERAADPATAPIVALEARVADLEATVRRLQAQLRDRH